MWRRSRGRASLSKRELAPPLTDCTVSGHEDGGPTMSASQTGDGVSQGAERAARQEREIQHTADVAEQKSFGKKKEQGAMQAGARPYPAPPFPEQHQEKPGDEAAL